MLLSLTTNNTAKGSAMEIELLEKRIAELEKQNAWLMGNTAMLGFALHAVMVNHPDHEGVASSVREAHEEFVSRALPRPFPAPGCVWPPTS